MSTKSQVSLSHFTQTLYGYVIKAQDDIRQNYPTLFDFIDMTLIIKSDPEPEDNPVNVIRINKEELPSLMNGTSRRLQGLDIDELAGQMVSYLGILKRQMKDVRADTEPKHTFIDRYGAFHYLYKIFVMLAIFINFLKITSKVRRYSVPDGKQQEFINGFNAFKANVNARLAANPQLKLSNVDPGMAENFKVIGQRKAQKQEQAQAQKQIEQEIIDLERQNEQLRNKIQGLEQIGNRMISAANEDQKQFKKQLQEQLQIKEDELSEKKADLAAIKRRLDIVKGAVEELLDDLKRIGSCVNSDLCHPQTTINRDMIERIIAEIQHLTEFKKAYYDLTALMPKMLQISID